MNVLILGSGGREHAFALKVRESKLCSNVYVAPGNSGTALIANNLNIGVNEFSKIELAIEEYNISVLIVGPEAPLVNGIRDRIRSNDTNNNLIIVGPGKAGAMLEGSKDFTKSFLFRHNIPTANYSTFTKKNIEEGFKYIDKMPSPYVLKADGLAAGKGVLIIKNKKEAKQQLKEILINSKFGKAGNKVVIEEFLDGIEISCFVLTDGNQYKILPSAKDYKRIGENDTGLNTGGMGAVSPPPFLNKKLKSKIELNIIKPTIQGLKKDNIPFVGFIFFGLIIVKEEPKVIEYNVRMGDPETEVVFPRIKSDFLELIMALDSGNLNSFDLQIDNEPAVTIVLVSGGYPEKYEINKQIFGLENISKIDSYVFHAGAKIENEVLKTSGGRVLAITSKAKSIDLALKKSYDSIKQVRFNKMYYRKDIGFDL